MKNKKFCITLLTAMILLISQRSIFAYELCVVAIFQNEDRFLKEWIEYHRLVGVDHFYLYNNESNDHYLEVLQPYIESGIVELTDWPNLWPNESFFFYCQANAYRDALQKCTGKTKWLAVIDTDEYILPMTPHNSIPECLDTYFSNCTAVEIGWICFGTSNVKLLNPAQTQISQFLLRSEENNPHNNFVKTIVKPDQMLDYPNPHGGVLKAGSPVTCPREILRINHYWTRDEYFLTQVKVPRYVKWGVSIPEILAEAQSLNIFTDTEILKFNDLLSHNLGLSPTTTD